MTTTSTDTQARPLTDAIRAELDALAAGAPSALISQGDEALEAARVIEEPQLSDGARRDVPWLLKSINEHMLAVRYLLGSHGYVIPPAAEQAGQRRAAVVAGYQQSDQPPADTEPLADLVAREVSALAAAIHPDSQRALEYAAAVDAILAADPTARVIPELTRMQQHLLQLRLVGYTARTGDQHAAARLAAVKRLSGGLITHW